MDYIEYGFYIIMLLVVFLLVYIPKKNGQKQIKKMQDELKIDDKIVTYSGLSGVVESIEQDRVIIKTNPDAIRIAVEKWAIAGLE